MATTLVLGLGILSQVLFWGSLFLALLLIMVGLILGRWIVMWSIDQWHAWHRGEPPFPK